LLAATRDPGDGPAPARFVDGSPVEALAARLLALVLAQDQLRPLWPARYGTAIGFVDGHLLRMAELLADAELN
jgi:hypothetical protein